ncbi:hypothetical protein B0H21DRAFT_748744 [Amylocystis lapponica]|nr:hypothetical protein B0H21DRAFT_748744 [Amylocystis lapponica]
MTWAIETGLATSFCVILMLIFNLVKPGWGIWICIWMVYAKVYSNAFLLSLNSRSSWRKTANTNRISFGNTTGTALDFSQSTVQIPGHTSTDTTDITFEMDRSDRDKPIVLNPGFQQC